MDFKKMTTDELIKAAFDAINRRRIESIKRVQERHPASTDPLISALQAALAEENREGLALRERTFQSFQDAVKEYQSGKLDEAAIRKLSITMIKD